MTWCKFMRVACNASERYLGAACDPTQNPVAYSPRINCTVDYCCENMNGYCHVDNASQTVGNWLCTSPDRNSPFKCAQLNILLAECIYLKRLCRYPTWKMSLDGNPIDLTKLPTSTYSLIGYRHTPNLTMSFNIQNDGDGEMTV